MFLSVFNDVDGEEASKLQPLFFFFFWQLKVDLSDGSDGSSAHSAYSAFEFRPFVCCDKCDKIQTERNEMNGLIKWRLNEALD